MQRIVRCLLRMLELLGITVLCTVALATIVALWHMIDSPQPLESILPGEARIYRWKYGHIFYKVLGAANAPPLVLLHKPGVGASAHEMRKIMEPLAQQYRVYTPDLLGFGLSDRPHIDYSAEIYTILCHDFLTDVVTQPAIVLASELSCNYAVAAASASPELFKGLVLLSPTALFAAEQGHKQGLDLLELAQTPVIGSMLYPLVSTRAALRYELVSKSSHCTTAELDYLYATTHQLGAQYAPLALIAGKLALDVSQQFETLQQPTVIIWGAQALNNARYITSQQHLPTHAQVILVQDSGLSVQEERPEAVVANVLQWSEESKVAATAIPAAASNKTAGVSMPAIDDVEAATVNTPPAQEAVSIGSGTPATEEVISPDTSTPTPEVTGSPEIQAYCVKCKKKVTMQNPQRVTMKNGRPAMRGSCPVCGSGLHRVGQVEKE